MQVILKEDVVNLGYKDDVVSVRNGYGRNYLIPQGLAVVATESALKVHAENLRQRKHKLEAIKKNAQDFAKKLDGVKLSVTVKTSKFGVIFGSVSAIQIAEELVKKGYEVDRKQIYLKTPIKEVGEYSFQVRLHRDVQVDLSIEVLSEEFQEEILKAKSEKLAKEEHSEEEIEKPEISEETVEE